MDGKKFYEGLLDEHLQISRIKRDAGNFADLIGRLRLDWIGLDWIGLDWIGLDWIGLDRIGTQL